MGACWRKGNKLTLTHSELFKNTNIWCCFGYNLGIIKHQQNVLHLGYRKRYFRFIKVDENKEMRGYHVAVMCSVKYPLVSTSFTFL